MRSFLAILSIGVLWMRPAQGRRKVHGDSFRRDGRAEVHESSGAAEPDDGSAQDKMAQPARVRSRKSDEPPSRRRVSCPVGTYNDPLGGGSCQPCPLGSYADEAASDRCAPCPPGSYAPLTGSSFCLPCDPSYYDGPGSDYGYADGSAVASVSLESNGKHRGGGVVYCVAPLYPVGNADDGTQSTEFPTSSAPSTIPTLSPSGFTSSSSPPSAVPSMGAPSPPPTMVPTCIPTTTSRPTNPNSQESYRPWPWNSHHRTPAPSPERPISPSSTPPPTVRRRWNMSEDARENRTDGGEGEDEDDPGSAADEADERLRPFLPLLALSAALVISGGAFAVKIWRQQQQQRRQLVTKTYSLRLPSHAPSATKPPPPPPPASPSSMDLSFLSCHSQERSSNDSNYWSDDSLMGASERSACEEDDRMDDESSGDGDSESACGGGDVERQ